MVDLSKYLVDKFDKLNLRIFGRRYDPKYREVLPYINLHKTPS